MPPTVAPMARAPITIRGIVHGVSLHPVETRREQGKEKEGPYMTI